MKLKGIFVDENTQEGLHSIILSGTKSEYEKVFTNFFKPEYVRNYLKKNIDYIRNSEIYKDEKLEDALVGIRDEVNCIFRKLNEPLKYQNFLEQVFQPLTNTDYKERDLKPSKIKLGYKDDRKYKNSKVRIYAIRISKNTFVITGGAIKLVKEMKDHPDTIDEEQKITKVRKWLNDNDIKTEDNLIYYYEQ